MDKGALWENFLITERIKQNNYKLSLARSYFWRTTQQQEIDYVEERSQRVYGFEFNWNPKKRGRLPKTFIDKYKAEGKVINKDNFP